MPLFGPKCHKLFPDIKRPLSRSCILVPGNIHTNPLGIPRARRRVDLKRKCEASLEIRCKWGSGWGWGVQSKHLP